MSKTEEKEENKTTLECVLCNRRSSLGFTIHRKFVCAECLKTINDLHNRNFEVFDEEYFDMQ